MWRVNIAIVLNDQFTVADIVPYETHCCGKTPFSKSSHQENEEGISVFSNDYSVYSLHSSIVGITLECVNENDTILSILESIFNNLEVSAI